MTPADASEALEPCSHAWPNMVPYRSQRCMGCKILRTDYEAEKQMAALQEAIANAKPIKYVASQQPASGEVDALVKEICGDVVNGGLIRNVCYTVWDNCHAPKHKDGNSDWFNDNLPTVNKAVEIIRKKLSALRPPEAVPGDEKSDNELADEIIQTLCDQEPVSDKEKPENILEVSVGQVRMAVLVNLQTRRELTPQPALDVGVLKEVIFEHLTEKLGRKLDAQETFIFHEIINLTTSQRDLLKRGG